MRNAPWCSVGGPISHPDLDNGHGLGLQPRPHDGVRTHLIRLSKNLVGPLSNSPSFAHRCHQKEKRCGRWPRRHSARRASATRPAFHCPGRPAKTSKGLSVGLHGNWRPTPCSELAEHATGRRHLVVCRSHECEADAPSACAQIDEARAPQVLWCVERRSGWPPVHCLAVCGTGRRRRAAAS